MCRGAWRSWPSWALHVSALLLLLSGCNERTVAATDDTTVERPDDPGAMYSSCEEPEDCYPLEYCLHPEGESGFCTDVCSDENSSDECEPLADANVICAWVDGVLPSCAISCAKASCPVGMRCEAVATLSGDRKLCF